MLVSNLEETVFGLPLHVWSDCYLRSMEVGLVPKQEVFASLAAKDLKDLSFYR